MIPFLLRRVLYSIPVILGVALIVLFLFDVAGGDPIQIPISIRALTITRPMIVARSILNSVPHQRSRFSVNRT